MNIEDQPTIGIMTALPKEYAAMMILLENHKDYIIPGRGSGRRYLLANLPAFGGGIHSIVLSLADMGNNIAATHSSRLLEHFPTVKYLIMIGIAGGVPNPKKPDDHVRLGDIVVSNNQGVIQYDFDKETATEIIYRYAPRPPSAFLLEGVKLLATGELAKKRPWLKYVDFASSKLNVKRPPEHTDLLVDTEDPNLILSHPEDFKRIKGEPRVFLAPIASANKLLKNPKKRDALQERFGVKAVEMEASGITDAAWIYEVGYLVVRGICDYCDSNKSDLWQEYAAIAAAAYTRSLLEVIASQNHIFVTYQNLNVLRFSRFETFQSPSSSNSLSTNVIIPAATIQSSLENNSRPQIFTLLEALQTDRQKIPEYVLECLFPLQPQLHGPSGQSPFWWFVKNGSYSQLALNSEYILRQTSSHSNSGEYQNLQFRAFLNSALLISLADCQRGFSRRALANLDYINPQVAKLGSSEILAWDLNIRSIIMGKTGDEDKSRFYANKAIIVASECGNYWLATAIRLRMLHRNDWNEWETGRTPENSIFEELLRNASEGLKFIDINSQLHIEAIVNAVQVLHYSWIPDEQYRAINSAERTLSLLSLQVDKDESSRMISEIGRIKLLQNFPLDAISYFKKSAPQRLLSGNLARLRYDLSWLADAYMMTEDIYKATLCAHAALLVHQRLYGNKKTDSGLVKRLQSILTKARNINISVLNKDLFLANINLLSESTGIDPIWWHNLLIKQ